jgi:hypothetical protein
VFRAERANSTTFDYDGIRGSLFDGLTEAGSGDAARTGRTEDAPLLLARLTVEVTRTTLHIQTIHPVLRLFRRSPIYARARVFGANTYLTSHLHQKRFFFLEIRLPSSRVLQISVLF